MLIFGGRKEMSLSDIYGCVCKRCGRYKTHIKDGICFECRKKIREGKLLLNNGKENLKTTGVYY